MANAYDFGDSKFQFEKVQTGSVIKATSNDAAANAVLSITVEDDDEGEELFNESGASVSYIATDPSGIPYLIAVKAGSYANTEYKLSGIKINDTVYTAYTTFDLGGYTISAELESDRVLIEPVGSPRTLPDLDIEFQFIYPIL